MVQTFLEYLRHGHQISVYYIFGVRGPPMENEEKYIKEEVVPSCSFLSRDKGSKVPFMTPSMRKHTGAQVCLVSSPAGWKSPGQREEEEQTNNDERTSGLER